MRVQDLWIPIVLSGLATHILSTLAWMVMPHHKPEWKKIPAEDEFQDWLESQKIPAEQFMFPLYDPKEGNSESVKAKLKRHKGMLVIWPDQLNMGKAIGLTLAFFFAAAFVIGYLASLALPAGASFGKVVQFVTTAGLLAHCSAYFPNVFWFRRKVAMEVLDGIVYAVATGLIFAYFWPAT